MYRFAVVLALLSAPAGFAPHQSAVRRTRGRRFNRQPERRIAFSSMSDRRDPAFLLCGDGPKGRPVVELSRSASSSTA